MPGKKKNFVFSARTTEEGLRILNGLRAELGIGWDELIITAVNATYGVQVSMLPRAEKASKPEKPPEVGKPKAAEKSKTKGQKDKGRGEKGKGEAKGEPEGEKGRESVPSEEEIAVIEE